MKTNQHVAIGLALTSILVAILGCSQTNQFTNPPSVKESDLEGIWEARYLFGGEDTLTLKSDGTFRQVYVDSEENYVFDSGWDKWILEKLPTGIVRLHLQRGRYYLAGIDFGENNGKLPCIENDCTLEGLPFVFYDPFAKEVVYMMDELLLVVQLDSTNNLILHHVHTSSDEGFVPIGQGGEIEIFYRK